MAMAHITQIDGSPNERRFLGEIGTNLYWRVAVGGTRTRSDQGATLIDEPSWVSELSGPIRPEQMGRFEFPIEESRFSRENRFVQMMSYRDQELRGPAVSSIVETRPSLGAPTLPLPLEPPPAIPMSISRAHAHAPSGYAVAYAAVGHTAPGVHPLRWNFARRSSAMDFGISAILAGLAPVLTSAAPMLASALPGLVSAIAPAAGNLVNQLIGGLAGGGRASAPSSPETTPPAAPTTAVPAPPTTAAPGGSGNIDPQVVLNIIEQIERLMSASPGGSRSRSASLFGKGTRASRQRAVLAARARARRQQMPTALGKPAIGSGYPQAMAVPVALLTQLMPLLQQVLTPETVQSIVNMPNQHMQTVFNAMRDAARLGIESHEQDLRHLREINPGVDDPALDSLLAGMSLGVSKGDPGLRWKRAETVRLSLTGTATVSIAGRQTTLLATDRPLSFPLSVALPIGPEGRTPTLRNARVELLVKDQQTLEVLHHQSWEVGDVAAAGPLPVTPTIAAGSLTGTPAGRDLLFCFALVWPNRNGALRGAPVQHLARLAEAYIFDRVEEGGERMTLNDESRFADYHHIVWSNRFRSDARRLQGELVYLCAALTREGTLHRRLEATLDSREVENTPTRRQVRLRSGFEFSVDSLAKLGTVIDPTLPPLDDAKRAAIMDTRFSEWFQRSTRISFDVRGIPDQAFRVRMIPVMAFARVYFSAAGEVDELGQVRSLSSVSASLPVPVAAQLRFEAMTAQPEDEPLFAGIGDFVPARLNETGASMGRGRWTRRAA